MSISTPDKTARLLLRAEQTVHRRGWDEPPMLASLHVTRPGVISLLPFPFRIENQPGGFLEFIAGVAEATPAHAHTFVDRPDAKGPTFGLAFVSEGWMLDVKDPDEITRVRESGMSLADHPARVEVRNISAVDITGQLFFINRIRGQKPTWHNNMEVGGRVVESLRRILLAGMKTMDGQEEAVFNLSTTFIKNDDDMQAAAEFRRKAAEE